LTLAVITFLFEQPREWQVRGRTKYSARHVNALHRAIAANLTVPHRFVCLTDQPEGIECETLPVWPAITVGGEHSCYRKIRAFDAEFQHSLGDRILCLDLDVAIMGDITPLVTDDDCRMLAGSRNARGQQVALYNGSMWLCRSGARHHVWADFEPEKARRMREQLIMPGGKRVKGSDQAWFSCVMPDEKVWTPGDGVHQFYMLKNGVVPDGARMVFFAGSTKPWSRFTQHNHPSLHEAWKKYDLTPEPIEEPVTEKPRPAGRARCACGTRVWHKGIPARCPVCGMPTFALA
jgi:hypothetical protein